MGPAIAVPIIIGYGATVAVGGTAMIIEQNSSKSAPSHRGKTMVRYDYGQTVRIYYSLS